MGVGGYDLNARWGLRGGFLSFSSQRNPFAQGVTSWAVDGSYLLGTLRYIPFSDFPSEKENAVPFTRIH